MGWRAIQIEVVLLNVFAVVALAIGESKKAFFQNRVCSIPKSEGKAQRLLIIANASESVFSPTIGARASLIVREIIPSISVSAVIFANGSPLTFAEIGPPFFPR